MRITTTLLALLSTLMLSAPVLALAHDCCCVDCCDDAATTASAAIDADAVLKVLAQYGFYLGPYADMIEAGGGGIAIGGGSDSDMAELSIMDHADEAPDAELRALIEAAAADAAAAEDLAANAADAQAAELHTLVFHCPVNFNDGSPIPAAQLDSLEKLLCERAGGFTVTEAQGAWEYEGQVYHEPVRRYMLGLPDAQIPALADEIEALLKGDYKQIAVWIEIDGEPEIR